ncbi:MAG: hypothetical protein JXR39_01020 [Marinilabiliaceae bacterium]|nr:hypothetical protein [Marinilabiliaceae bacterium]
MKTTQLLFATLAMSGMLLMTSCNKDEETINQNEQIAADDDAAEEMSNLLDALVETHAGSDDEAANAPALKTVSLPNVTAISTGESFWPREITIDYGSENTAITIGNGNNARTVNIRGKIVVEKSGPLFIDNSVWNISFDDFYVNDNAIEGTQTYTNSGLNDKQNWTFVWASDLTITATDESWIKRTATKTREMTAGASTPLNIWDDEFTINGTASGSNSRGWSYNNAIANVLHKRICRFPVSGTVTLTNGANNTFVLNYGNGECDNEASLTDTNGNQATIVLGKRWMK